MWPFDSNKQQMYQQYTQAYNTGDYSNIDPNHAAGQLQAFMQSAPPEVQQQIFMEHFNQMPPEYGVNPNDPSSMARGFQRMGQERPDVSKRIFAHPVLVAGAVGLTALVAKRMLEHRDR